MTARAMGSHHAPNKGETDDWLTPPRLVNALGPFDLDPCASVDQPWPTAMLMHTINENGLLKPWNGMVWLNPPYGPATWGWLDRLADHGNGIALIFARTETAGFHREVWRRATALYFFEGRLFFHRPVTGERAKANAGAPSVLVAYGDAAANRIFKVQDHPGRFIRLK